jgi:hypothetical protein
MFSVVRSTTDIPANDSFAPKAAIPPKVGFGALDDLVTPITEAMLSSLIAATTTCLGH